MREVIFRGVDDKGEWYFGDFITDVREYNRTCDRAYILPHWDKLNAPVSVRKETVGQYTGLKDKDGELIYEGDIVFVKNNNCDKGYRYKIEKEIGIFILVNLGNCDMYEQFVNCWNDDVYPLSQLYWDNSDSDEIISKLEVIGNVYENKELLDWE